MKKIHLHQTIIPQKLKKEFLEIALKSEFNWREAKAKDDFKLFDKYFSKVMKLLIEITDIKAKAFAMSRYDVLIDQYDPGINSQDLDKVFSKLAKQLPPLIDKIIEKQKAHKAFPETNVLASKQKEIFSKILKTIGLSEKWARIDESVHPFCTGYVGDVRITTRYDENHFISGLMGLIHETGHAIYDNQLPQKDQLQPIGQAMSISLHESQSLFMEMQVGRSAEFCNYIFPKIKKELGLANNVTSDDLYHHLNKVEKSYIRVDADEVTYPLHVIMRYEIEKKLINQEIKTSDLPDIWNKKIKQYFNLKKPTDKMGCLQDIHWSDGSLGYFPTYSLGAIYASQIADKIKKTDKNFSKNIEAGKFAEIRKTLKTNIHQYGSQLPAKTIIKNFTGGEANVDCFLAYLKNKYL